MKAHITSISEKSIMLSTALSEDAFGKVQAVQLLDEAGWVATFAADASITFSAWKFGGTTRDAQGNVAFVGTSFGNGKTLFDIFETGTRETIAAAAVLVCKALSAALAQQCALIAVGAAGICLFSEGSQTRILFLPPTIFERCATNTSLQEAAAYHGCYVHKGLTGSDALLFTRAVIAYRALCGVLPYAEPQLSARQADMYDARFIPIYLYVPAADARLLSAIDCALQIPVEPRAIPGERRYTNEKEIKKRKALLNAAQQFALPVYESALQTPTAQSPEDVQAREAFTQKQTKTVLRRRFFRRNQSRLLAACIALVLGSWALFSFHQGNKGLATTKGLDSWHTTQALYATIHKSSVPHLQEIARGKQVKNLRHIVSGFYVTNRSRYAMNQEDGTVSPAEWFFLKNKTNFWQYGLTQLRIDEKTADSSYQYPTRADKPKKLTAEAGLTLKRGTTVQHTADYFLITNDGSARIHINKTSDTVTLTWKRDRWIVTNIQSKSKQNFVFTKDFKAAYQTALDETNGDVVQAVALLRETYDWLPTDEEIRAGEVTLTKKISTHAF